MSLFPAYSNEAHCSKKNEDENQANVTDLKLAHGSWLENPSFAIEVTDIPLPATPEPQQPVTNVKETSRSSSHEEKEKYKRHKKKSKKHKCKSQEEEHFYEDKFSAKGNLSVMTLSRPAVALYRARRTILGGCRYGASTRKRIHDKRYYMQQLDDHREPGTGGEFQVEDELTSKTAEFNRELAEDPGNVDMWIKYITYQETVWQFECTYRHGEEAKGRRVMMERKMAILNRALTHNPDSEVLLRERIGLAESGLPADVLAQMLEDALKRQPGSVLLWRAYVRAIQCSLSLCRVPSVISRYEQGMAKLKLLWRGQCLHTWEDGILDLLLDAGLFLRQAGFWEQLWILLRLYLEYNTDTSKLKNELFKNFSLVSDGYITELEETILSSQLPLSELWYRVERLREGVHWLPWTASTDCEDPQRLVFPEDVSDLMYPISSPPCTLRLVLIVFSLLKVPLLPCRDTALQVLGLDRVPWGLDSPEILLATFYPIGTVDLGNSFLLKDANDLVSGPQYLLNQWPGQEQYLEFVIKIFTSCGLCLPEPVRTVVCVWWLRFERLLLVLEKQELCKIPQNRKKRLKSTVKEFLKQEKNRNNCLFYLEYALIEHELGQNETACRILYGAITAQHAQHAGVPVISILCEQQKSGLCFVYRTLCELLLRVDSAPPKAVAVLVALALGNNPSETEAVLARDQIGAATDKFRHITAELLLDVAASAPADGTMHLLPHLIVEWVSCHAWLLALTQSVWVAGAMLEDVLSQLPTRSTTTTLSRATCQKEALFESYVSILHHFCHSTVATYSVLQDVLHRALQEFPNNLCFLATVAKIETSMTWWKSMQYFSESDCLLAQVFQVFVAKQRQSQLEQVHQQNHTFLNIGGPVLPDSSNKNRVQAVLNRLLCKQATRRCPMLWRLHLQLLYRQGKDGTESTRETAFYRAVEECPWVKALYVDAVRLLPTQLPHLQDLLIEKELRLHVTPEELDILRSSPNT